jgi:hypothetical protein
MTDQCEFRRLPGIDLYLWLRLVLATLTGVAALAWALV